MLAALHLAERDEALARVIAAAGAMPIPQRPSTFATLARAIAYQQLSGKAAATIWGRVRDAGGGAASPRPRRSSRGARPRCARRGSRPPRSRPSRTSPRRVRTKEIVPEALRGLSDDEVIARLTRVRGIGRWSAQMHLMFSLGRPDVWPTGDLGVRKGFARWRGMAGDPTEKAPRAPGRALPTLPHLRRVVRVADAGGRRPLAVCAAPGPARAAGTVGPVRSCPRSACRRPHVPEGHRDTASPAPRRGASPRGSAPRARRARPYRRSGTSSRPTPRRPSTCATGCRP